MATTYKGESLGKKITRLLFWSDVMEKLPNWETAPKMVLASREAGDVSVLLGLGAEPSSIIGVDNDKDALEEAQAKFPAIKFLYGDVEQLAKQYRNQLGILHLDFCGPLHKGLMDKILRCSAAALRNEALLGCAFMYGRELGLAGALVKQTQLRCEARKEIALGILPHALSPADFAKRLRATGYTTMFDIADKFKDLNSLEEVRSVIEDWEETKGDSRHLWLDRVESLTAYMNEAGAHLRCAPYLLRAYRYHSRTNKNRGVPMMYYLGRIFRPFDRQMRIPVFIKKFFEAFEDVPVEEDDEFGWYITKDKFRKFAIQRAREHGSNRTSLLLNMSPGTLAAWLAHDTRKLRAG